MLRLRLLSQKMYADSSLVRANVSGHNLSPSGMTVEEFREKAVGENGLFIVREQQTDEMVLYERASATIRTQRDGCR